MAKFVTAGAKVVAVVATVVVVACKFVTAATALEDGLGDHRTDDVARLWPWMLWRLR